MLGDEIRGGDGGEGGVEMEDQHRIRACFGEQALALVERGEAEGRQVRLEETHRMRIERCDQGRAGFGARASDRRADHRLVPARKSVRPEERRGGKEGVSKCKYRWSPYK